MKQSRMDALSDGVFAIVMTLLVFEIRLPALPVLATNADILNALIFVMPVFLSYVLSFAVLFTYWRAHHFIASVYAKNIDLEMTNINAIFLFFVALVPFSSRLLGDFHTSQAAILVFGLNIIFIGLSLFWMRHYAHVSSNIESNDTTALERRHAYVRILFPVFCALIAMYVAFMNTEIALILLTVGILFNLLPKSTTIIDRIFNIK